MSTPAARGSGPATRTAEPPIGVTLPGEWGLPRCAAAAPRLARLGYASVWSSEVDAADGFSPLVAALVAQPSLGAGTAVVSSFTRGPACLAQSAAALASLAPGRVVLGVGSSSDVIVRRWNGIPFEHPLERTRDVVHFLRSALAGEKISRRFSSFEIDGFRLGSPPAVPPRIFVAGLRPRMLALAGAEADGAILNWLSADDVRRVVPVVREAGQGAAIAARIFVCPSSDTEAVRAAARRYIAGYLTVPVYRRFHEWLGRGPALADLWKAWDAGDRAGALRAIPDEIVDDLVVHGSAEACWRQIRGYMEAGVELPILAVLPFGVDLEAGIEALAPVRAPGDGRGPS